MDVEWCQPSTAGNEDALCGLTCGQLVKFVLPPCKAVRLCFCQIFKEQINRVLVFLIVLQHLHSIEHFQQGRKILFLYWGFIMQIGDKRSQQKTFRFFPERVAASPLTLGVGHKRCNQFQNVLFTVDVAERIVVHRLFEVDGVQDFYLVAVFQHGLSTFKHDCTFRVSDDIGAVTLQEVWFQPKSRFAAAGAAYHQHIFVPGVLGVGRAVGHHQTFRFGQNDVVGKLGCHERLNVFRVAPPGRAVLHAMTVLLCIFAAQIYGKP